MSLHLDYLVFRRNMFVGSIAVNPQETTLLLLGTPRGLKACSIRSMLSCSLRKWLSLYFCFIFSFVFRFCFYFSFARGLAKDRFGGI